MIGATAVGLLLAALLAVTGPVGAQEELSPGCQLINEVGMNHDYFMFEEFPGPFHDGEVMNIEVSYVEFGAGLSVNHVLGHTPSFGDHEGGSVSEISVHGLTSAVDLTWGYRFDGTEAEAYLWGVRAVDAAVSCGPAPADWPSCGGQPAHIVGSHGWERISGSDGGMVIHGQGSGDRIDGGAGDDIMCGGPGDDNIHGSGGADTVFGGSGDDRVIGGRQGDVLRGGSGDDVALGGLGDDVIQGGTGRDRLWAGPGADHLRGGRGNDLLRSQTGSDTVWGGEGADEIHAGPGDDEIFGGPGRDDVRANDGDDAADGGPGNDKLRGGLGTDRLWGAEGFDVCWGEQLRCEVNHPT